MHATIAHRDSNGTMFYEKTPVTASIVIVGQDNSIVDTYRHREGQSEIVINLDKAVWVQVDLND
jgi:hypothetical protein